MYYALSAPFLISILFSIAISRVRLIIGAKVVMNWNEWKVWAASCWITQEEEEEKIQL